jgi:hypothetical protein
LNIRPKFPGSVVSVCARAELFPMERAAQTAIAPVPRRSMKRRRPIP